MAESTVSKLDAHIELAKYTQERDQLGALVISLLNRLEPNNVDEPDENCDITAWRLCEVIYDKVLSIDTEQALRKALAA